MMRPLRLILPAFILFLSGSVNAQLLNNTRWQSFDDQDHFDLFFNFQNDTLSVSPDNSIWIPTSVYGEAGNVLTLMDIDTFFCNLSDLGIYHFSIVQDTLRLTIVSEDCYTRGDYNTSHYFVDFPIGISELEKYKNVNVYPVPFNQTLNVKTDGGSFDFALLDVSGRKVKELTFRENACIGTDNLEPGMYLYELRIAGEVVKSGTVLKY